MERERVIDDPGDLVCLVVRGEVERAPKIN